MIPVGFCQCGCGQRTRIIKYNDKSKGWVKGEYKKYIFRHMSKGHKHTKTTKELLSKKYHERIKCPEDHPAWNNGIRICCGYVYIKDKNNGNVDKQGYVKRGVKEMQKKIGRLLRPWIECVHHIDGNRMNDDINNLSLCTRAEHNKIYAKRGKPLCNHLSQK